MSKSQIKKLIYVVDSNGKSLMPTTRNRKVRHWLATGQAHWFGNSQKTIQFTRPVNQPIQPVTVGVDLGRHTGISAVDQSNNREYYSAQVERPYVQEVKRNPVKNYLLVEHHDLVNIIMITNGFIELVKLEKGEQIFVKIIISYVHMT